MPDGSSPPYAERFEYPQRHLRDYGIAVGFDRPAGPRGRQVEAADAAE